MFSHPQGLRQDGGTLIRVTAGSFSSRALGTLVSSLSSQLWGGYLEVEGAAGAASSGQQTQLGTEAEDTGQGLSGLERGDNDLGGRGQGLKQSFASTAVGNLCLPCGERCGCLWGQAGQRPGPSPLLSGLAVGS